MALSFRTKLLATYIGLVTGVFAVAFFGLDRALDADLRRQAFARMEEQARAVTEWVSASRHLDKLAYRLGKTVGGRVTLIDRHGTVLGDSTFPGVKKPPMPNEAASPEVAAVAGGAAHGRAIRDLQGVPMLLVTVAAPDVIVRIGNPLSEVESTVTAMRVRLVWGMALGFLGAILVGLFATRMVSKPLRTMVEAARRIGSGDYRTSPTWDSQDELGLLSQTLSRLAVELDQRIGELSRADAVRRDFVANVSHELRTPVAAISGYAETLLGGVRDEKTQREFLEIIYRHARRISELVDDLLKLAELEDPAAPHVREPVSVTEVARNVESTVGDKLDRAGATLDLRVPDGLLALADPDAVERVVQNLVDNAIKYGGPGVRVTIQAERRAQRIALAVSDNGPGIAAGDLPRIFERFYRTEAGRKSSQEGVGLGLAIVKQMVESMGATIRVESVVGRGTTFIVELPTV